MRRRGRFFDTGTTGTYGTVCDEVVYISQEQRQEFFDLATGFYGKNKGNAVVKYICANMGLESTTNMTVEQFEEAMIILRNGIEADKKSPGPRKKKILKA